MHTKDNDALAHKPKRGFAAMSEEKRKEIASKGGKAAHKKGKAHKFNSSTGRSAGQKGGKAISNDREHMARIGVLGGKARSKQAGHESYDELIETGKKLLDDKDKQGAS